VRRLLGCVGLVAVAVSCHIAPAPQPTAVFPAGWRFRSGEAATFAKHAMVVSNNEIASRVGAEIMRRGGNAIDLAVAVGFVMTVPLADVVAPVIRLAEEAWVIDTSFSHGLSSGSALLTQFEGKRILYPSGAPLAAELDSCSPELAWTLC
jgi:gamma-glutamyltranspeptidase